MPGIHLNVSKKGISTTFGMRGASITTGKNGTYLNTSIPGTGMYNRQKIGGKNRRTNSNIQFDNHNTMANNNGCLAQGGLIISWIGLIFITLLVFTQNSIWGVVFAVAVIIMKIATRTKKETISDNQENINTTEITGVKNLDETIKQKTIVDNSVDIDFDLTEIEESIISQEYFNEVRKSVNKLLDLYNYLKTNEAFLSLHSLKYNKNEIDVRNLFVNDILTCYVKFNQNIDLDKRYGLGLLLFLVSVCEAKITHYKELDIFKETAKELVETDLNILKLCQKKFPSINLFVADLLKDYNSEMQKNYLIALYRFASIAAKADNNVTEDEQRWLSELLKMNEEKKIEAKISEKPKIKPILKSDSQSELNSLIGLQSVKTEISTLTNFIKIQQERQLKGLKTSQPSYHCVFTGNPGTGKTTVARIVAEIYRELGILKKGHLVETDRSGLVAEYVGQTAVKTNKFIDTALDGVLFIDEAYSLISNSKEDFGKEAIATLLKRMEDNRDRLVVILAGYSAEMQQFIDSNPGLQSRFNRYIEFPDYSADELYQIFEKNAREFDYTISKDAEIPLKAYLENKVANKDKNFGNARFVRNLFEKTIEKQANRLSKEVALTDEKLSKIGSIDIPM
jgi:AAA+ superfamily predicted ATPase